MAGFGRGTAQGPLSVYGRLNLLLAYPYLLLQASSSGAAVELRSHPAFGLFSMDHTSSQAEGAGVMPHTFANTMFSEQAKKLQQQHGSRGQYERMARSGTTEQKLGPDEIEFISARDSFYISTVTPDGWPYVQHRGGVAGFLLVLDEHTLAFADYSGNKQYITAGNLAVNDRFALFLMDYPNRVRLKIIGHARIVEPGNASELEARVRVPEEHTPTERILVLDVVGFDWNCSQHITPRYTLDEIQKQIPGVFPGI
jgi:predicted pyridoxine 5'-phosphate oxidase superfamily flavin-nucleotide-binding protein